jgi:predicted AAA+ superfamily ATPase
MNRSRQLSTLRGLLSRHRAVAILGARQVGKTTLAKQLLREHKGPTASFDLENPADLARLDEPMLALEGLRGLVMIDEVQRRPEIFPVLRVLIDRPKAPKFLILGSASPDLLRQSSESLAGRILYHHLEGFSLEETGAQNLQKLWLRGSFPRSYLARSNQGSNEWRRGFVQTFLERDIPQLGFSIPATTLQRFWTMLAHYHAQVWNSSEFGRSFGVSDSAVRRYLDLLAGTFVVRLLLPWQENIAKRQVKSPKVYFTDSGLLHTLLGIDSREALETHPRLGASWEGFMLSEVIARLGARPEECFFWATHSGAELDLLIVRGQQRRGFEFKRSDAPTVTPSMKTAITDLGLSRVDVVHAGAETFPMAPQIRAVAARRLLLDIEPLR